MEISRLTSNPEEVSFWSASLNKQVSWQISGLCCTLKCKLSLFPFLVCNFFFFTCIRNLQCLCVFSHFMTVCCTSRWCWNVVLFCTPLINKLWATFSPLSCPSCINTFLFGSFFPPQNEQKSTKIMFYACLQTVTTSLLDFSKSTYTITVTDCLLLWALFQS